MAILFKKSNIQKLQTGGALDANAENANLKTAGAGLAAYAGEPIDYDAALGASRYNTTDDIVNWNVKKREQYNNWPERNNMPLNDLDKSFQMQDNFYKLGAGEFINKIGDDAYQDVLAKRTALSESGLKGQDLTNSLYTYASGKYGDVSVPKSDIYGRFTPKRAAITREAFKRVADRRNMMTELGGGRNVTTAGRNDPNDELFGWRNFVAPRGINNRAGYKGVWNLPETESTRLQKRQ